ncbi:hypothetical protein DFP73DRAFT_585689 [Morchella snyderi]|nr:hypothetical protein DFP73DRAFT_585689 [Morchella snyderi]
MGRARRRERMSRSWPTSKRTSGVMLGLARVVRWLVKVLVLVALGKALGTTGVLVLVARLVEVEEAVEVEVVVVVVEGNRVISKPVKPVVFCASPPAFYFFSFLLFGWFFVFQIVSE